MFIFSHFYLFYICRNFQHVVDEDDLKWMTNEKKISLLLTHAVEKNVMQPLRFRRLSHFSEMQNDGLMHHNGLTVCYLYNYV